MLKADCLFAAKKLRLLVFDFLLETILNNMLTNGLPECNSYTWTWTWVFKKGEGKSEFKGIL